MLEGHSAEEVAKAIQAKRRDLAQAMARPRPGTPTAAERDAELAKQREAFVSMLDQVATSGHAGDDAAARSLAHSLISDYRTDPSREKDPFRRALEACAADAACRDQLERSFVDVYQWVLTQQPIPSPGPLTETARFFARLLAERAATIADTTADTIADTTPIGGISWRVLSCIRLSARMPPNAYMYVHGLVASLALDFMTPDQFERTLERDPATAAYVEGFAPTDPASMPPEDARYALSFLANLNPSLYQRSKRAMEHHAVEAATTATTATLSPT